MEVKIKYFDKEISKLEQIKKGSWIDTRVSDIEEYDEYTGRYSDVKMSYDGDEFLLTGGRHYKIWLGFGMELPEGWEAHTAPRGSTGRKTGLIQTNGVGVVDTVYCGDNDEWFIPVYATNDTRIKHNDRLYQFRLIEVMPEINFQEVENLSGVDRGGDGSTGESVFDNLELPKGKMVFSIHKFMEYLAKTDYQAYIYYSAYIKSGNSWCEKADGKSQRETSYNISPVWMVPESEFIPYTENPDEYVFSVRKFLEWAMSNCPNTFKMVTNSPNDWVWKCDGMTSTEMLTLHKYNSSTWSVKRKHFVPMKFGEEL